MTLLESPFLIASLILGLSSLCFGLFVLTKAPKKRLNQLWFIFSLSVAIWGFGGLWGASDTDPRLALLKWRLVGAVGINWIAVLYFHFICHFIGIKRPKVLFVSYLIGAIFACLYLSPLIFSETRYLWNEIRWPLAGPLHPLFFFLWSMLIFYSHWELWLHYRQSSGNRMSQIKLFFLGSIIGYSCGVLEYLPVYKIDLYPWANFGVALYPYIMTYAILQYRLFDISVVIRRSLVYSILITLLTVGYFGLVYGIEQISRATFGYQSKWLSLAAFALMALAFQPLKVGIQRMVDWVIFRAPQEAVVKRMERLEQEALQLEKLKAVATMAAGLCHELRNPIQAIHTYTEFLPERYDDPRFREKYCETMKTEIARISDLLKQLMDFAKPKTPSFQWIEPHKILDSTLDFLGNEFVARRVHLEKRYEANGTRLQADPDQLRQVVLNLTLNAIQAIGQKGQVTVTTRQENGWLSLEIEDTGPGIDPQLLPKLFEPFNTTKPDGTGLGLSIVHSIIRQHRGTIAVQNQPGKGATFTVRIPI